MMKTVNVMRRSYKRSLALEEERAGWKLVRKDE